jgi:hypothetical protein
LRNAAVSLLRAGYYTEGTGLAATSLALDPDQPDLREMLAKASKDLRRARGGILKKLRNLFGRSRPSS